MIPAPFRHLLQRRALEQGKSAGLWRKFCKPSPELWAEYLRRHGGFHAFGRDCHINPAAHIGDPHLVSIGNNVWITGGWMACHDGSAIMINRAEGSKFDAVAPIVIGDNVFIGYGAILRAGVTVGARVIIGAGSVVTRDVPDDTVVAGNPARRICSYGEYRDKLAARNESLPWRALIEAREGGFDAALEPELNRQRVAHFFGPKA